MARERIAYGVDHIFEVALLSQADTKLHQTTPTLLAGDAKLRTRTGALANIAAEYVAFTSGSVEPKVGETLTGATSTETCVVVGVRVTSGTWGGADAAGALFVRNVSGVFQAENLDGDLAGANCMSIGGDFTAGLMASLGGGLVAIPVTAPEASTDYGVIELVDAAGAEWCSDGVAFETYGHENSADPQGCILTDTVNAAGQSASNIRLSGAPATAPKVGYYFEVVSGTGVGQAGFVKTYVAGATYDVTPYVALDVTLDDTSVVKFYRDAKRVPAHVVASETGSLPAVTLTNVQGIKKNTQYANFTFPMYDATDPTALKTGLTVTAQRSIDGAAYGACANAVSEIGTTGTYKITLAAADLNGDAIALKFTSAGAVPQVIFLAPVQA